MTAMSFDVAVVRYLNGFVGRSAFLDGVIVFFAHYLPFITGGFFFIFLYILPASQRWHVFFVAAAATIVARLIVVELIRFFYKRPRPFETLPLKRLVAQFQWSFPSGHAAFFFALAGVVYFYDPLWGMGFIVAAVAMTLGRIAAGVHYPSDILMGALIGALAAWGSGMLIPLLV